MQEFELQYDEHTIFIVYVNCDRHVEDIAIIVYIKGMEHDVTDSIKRNRGLYNCYVEWCVEELRRQLGTE